MVKIERGSPPAKTAMDKKRKEVLREIRKLAESGELKSKNFNKRRLWSKPEVKDFLCESQYGKCCYCERKRDPKEFDVEHFRPKAQVKEDENHPGYWWLAYNWDNLLIACKSCNNKKGSHFPLEDEEKRAYGENCDLGEEEPLLINPLKENPELFIDYDVEGSQLMVKATGRCERGEKTVNELTGINEREVMQERARKLKFYRMIRNSMWDGNDELNLEIYRDFRECVSPSGKFAGLARFYFRKEGCL